MNFAKNAFQELRDFFRIFDPTHAWVKNLFTMLGYIDAHNMAHLVICPVRMYTG